MRFIYIPAKQEASRGHLERQRGHSRLAVETDDTVVDVLRDRLHLTGTKLVCGGGVCGACTVLFDGEPVAGCLLPAVSVDGRVIETIEGVAARAHPVIRAFAAHNALQCGFCTPGFVVEAAAFHDDGGQRTAAPNRQTPPSPRRWPGTCAAAGHIRRSTGGTRGLRWTVRRRGPPSGPRVEAAAKVTGAAKYTVDVGRMASSRASSCVRRIRTRGWSLWTSRPHWRSTGSTQRSSCSPRSHGALHRAGGAGRRRHGPAHG